jgi:hypothetical protein
MAGTICAALFSASHNAFRHLICICVLISDSVKRFAGFAPECSKIKRKNRYQWYRGTCWPSPHRAVLSPNPAMGHRLASPISAPCPGLSTTIPAADSARPIRGFPRKIQHFHAFP